MNKELRVDSRFADGIRDGKQLQIIKRHFDDKYTTVSLMNGGFAVRDKVPVKYITKITISKYNLQIGVIETGILDTSHPETLEKYATKTGFKDWNHLLEYICAVYELPFSGVLIKWEPIT